MDLGVAIFFVISGFLLFRPHANGWLLGTLRPRTRQYLWHRALRILPALWLAVGAAALLLKHPIDPVVTYARYGTLTQIYGAGHGALGLTQMWSLATEVAFYLALPLAAWVLTRGTPSQGRIRASMLVLLLLPFLGASWMATTAALGSGVAALWLPGYVGWFGLGMALALWRSARAAGRWGWSSMDLAARHPGTLWSLAGALYLLIVSPIAGPYALVQPTPGQAAVKSLAYGLLGALIVLPTIAARSPAEDPPAVARLGGGTATFVGDISYGIFCYHLIVLGVLEQVMDYRIFTGGFLRLYIPTLVVTIVVATLSFYCVERPIMRWGRRRERKRLRIAALFGDSASTATVTASRTSS